jgi:hypothetical protein
LQSFGLVSAAWALFEPKDQFEIKPAGLEVPRRCSAKSLFTEGLGTFRGDPSGRPSWSCLHRMRMSRQPPSKAQRDHRWSTRCAYLKNLCRYWRLQGDQEKTPFRPANVGDMMLPSDLLHVFPSPSWTIPKLHERERWLIQNTEQLQGPHRLNKYKTWKSFLLSL